MDKLDDIINRALAEKPNKPDALEQIIQEHATPQQVQVKENPRFSAYASGYRPFMSIKPGTPMPGTFGDPEAEIAIMQEANLRHIKDVGQTATGLTRGLGGVVRWFGAEELGNGIVTAMNRLDENYLKVEDINFSDKLVQSVASGAMFMLPGFGVKIGLEALLGARALATWLGTSTMAILESGVNAGDVYNQLTKEGKSRHEAVKGAHKQFWTELPLDIVLDRWILKDFEGTSVLKRAVTGGKNEAVQEALQEVIRTWATDRPYNGQALANIIESGLYGGFGGLTLGGGMQLIYNEMKATPPYRKNFVTFDVYINDKTLADTEGYIYNPDIAAAKGLFDQKDQKTKDYLTDLNNQMQEKPPLHLELPDGSVVSVIDLGLTDRNGNHIYLPADRIEEYKKGYPEPEKQQSIRNRDEDFNYGKALADKVTLDELLNNILPEYQYRSTFPIILEGFLQASADPNIAPQALVKDTDVQQGEQVQLYLSAKDREKTFSHVATGKVVEEEGKYFVELDNAGSYYGSTKVPFRPDFWKPVLTEESYFEIIDNMVDNFLTSKNFQGFSEEYRKKYESEVENSKDFTKKVIHRMAEYWSRNTGYAPELFYGANIAELSYTFDVKNPSTVTDEFRKTVLGETMSVGGRTAETSGIVKSWIDIFNSADPLSTLIHEHAHVLNRILSKEDFNTVLESFGDRQADGSLLYTLSSNEKFALAFEKWLYEKKALDTNLSRIFENIRNFIKTVLYNLREYKDFSVPKKIDKLFSAIMTDPYVRFQAIENLRSGNLTSYESFAYKESDGFVEPISQIDFIDQATYFSGFRTTVNNNSLTGIFRREVEVPPGSDIVTVLGDGSKYSWSRRVSKSFMQWIVSPEYLYPEGSPSEKLAVDIINGQLQYSHEVFQRIHTFLRDLEHWDINTHGTRGKLTTKEQIDLRGYVEELYELRSVDREEFERRKDSNYMYKKANEIIDFFEDFRKRIIESKLRVIAIENPLMFEAAMDIVNLGRNFTELDITNIASDYQVDPIKLVEAAEELINVRRWGIKDFVSNIEAGMYRVYDSGGHVRALGKTRKLAEDKVKELAVEDPGAGPFKISPEFHKPLNPLKPREQVLRGEKNILDTIRAYGHVVSKRVIFDPIRATMEKQFSNDEGMILFPKDHREALRAQFNAAYGQYALGDMLFDYVSKAVGAKPLMWTKTIETLRGVTAVSKLGYRGVASLVNFIFGHGHTWVKHSLKEMSAGAKFLASEDGKKLIEEEIAYLGVDLATEATGQIHGRLKLWQPLGIFSLPEKGIRKLAYATAYTSTINNMGNEKAAREAGRRAVRLESFLYNIAALPRIMRGPAGRLVTQFKTYLIREVEFMSTLSGKEWVKYLGLQLAMSGPRGLVLMLKSLPILGLLGAFDKAEEWLMSNEKKGAVGLPGLAGTDISAPATFQFLPNKTEDYAGPAIAAMIGFYKEVFIPAIYGAGNVPENLWVWGKDEVVIAKYWDKFIQTVLSEDGWIRDKNGRLVMIDNKTTEAIAHILGIASTKESSIRVAQSILHRELAKDKLKRTMAYNSIVRAIEKGDTEGLEDLVTKSTALGLSPDVIEQLYVLRTLSPQQRAMLRARVVDKARAWGIFESVAR